MLAQIMSHASPTTRAANMETCGRLIWVQGCALPRVAGRHIGVRVRAQQSDNGGRQAWPLAPRSPPLAPPPPPTRLCPAYLFTLTRRRSLLAALCRTAR